MDAKSFPPIPSSSFCSVSFCAGSQADMRAMSPSECDQCVSECDAESCAINLEKEQCTDRCLVVPCEQQCLDACGPACFDLSQTICDSNQCQSLFTGPRATTSGTFVNPGSATLLHRPNAEYNYPPLDCNSPAEDIEAFLCACNNYDHTHQFRPNVCAKQYHPPSRIHPNDAYTAASLFHPPSVERSSTPSSPTSALFSPVLTSNSSSRSTPDISAASGLLLPSTSAKIRSDVGEGDRCLWGKCGHLLSSPEELTNHLTTDHLNRYFNQHHEQLPPDSFLPADGSQVIIQCLWNNCNLYHPLVPSTAGPSEPVTTDAYLDLLLRHIQQDHLGALSIPSETAQTSLSGDTFPDSRIENDIPFPGNSISESLVGKSELFCRWRACPLANVPFASAAELTQHLTDVHVGMGNSRYHCYWADCHRHGESGFSSKQKILRHIQSHTGYRPFRCELCDQPFSEAATLQQHMRRHTKEKPFICPEPGCGKAFAIAGALTIHRRVHTGNKPFQCKYCHRSFAESSNLSKHIRTHTGDRPYACNFPGCDKRFARPDQAARHRNTHEKKRRDGIEGKEY